MAGQPPPSADRLAAVECLGGISVHAKFRKPIVTRKRSAQSTYREVVVAGASGGGGVPGSVLPLRSPGLQTATRPTAPRSDLSTVGIFLILFFAALRPAVDLAVRVRFLCLRATVDVRGEISVLEKFQKTYRYKETHCPIYL